MRIALALEKTTKVDMPLIKETKPFLLYANNSHKRNSDIYWIQLEWLLYDYIPQWFLKWSSIMAMIRLRGSFWIF